MARFENWEAQKEKRMQVEFLSMTAVPGKSRWKNTGTTAWKSSTFWKESPCM